MMNTYLIQPGLLKTVDSKLLRRTSTKKRSIVVKKKGKCDAQRIAMTRHVAHILL